MNRPSLNEFIKATEKIYDVCRNDIPIRAGQNQTREQICVIAIYCTIIELSSGFLMTIKQEQSVCSATLLRGLMEYYIELLYILEDPSNMKKLITTSQMEQKALVNEVNNSKDENFDEIKANPEFAVIVNDINMSMKGKSKLRIEDRFKNVNLEDWYTRYRCLSSEAHPNIGRYFGRYLRTDTEGGIKFNPKYKPDRDETEVWISTLAEILIGSAMKIHEFFPDGNPDIKQRTFDLLTGIWGN